MIKHNPIFNLLLLLICYLPMKAQNYYDQQWKSIENNYKKGQYKSNLPLILEIQKKAVQENNMVQLIKSLKSEFSIINTTDDDTQNNTASVFFKKIQSFENQLKGNDQLVYQVLSKNFVMDYFNQNNWKIRQNTNLDLQNLETIETWTTLDFKNYLSKKFLSLEKQNDELRKIDFSPYQSIFSQIDFQKYFPKIADYNALQYIDFLKNSNLFTKNELNTNQQKVLSIEKQLINDNSGNGRLYFENLKLNDECEFNNCKNILAEKIKLYNSTTQGDYKVMIADDIIEKLQSDKKLVDAMDWIKKVKKEYPKSEFIDNIINRENGILQPELNINYENTTLANKPIHIVANYKNANAFSINIYDASSDINGYINYINNNWENNSFEKVKKTLVRTEKFVIPKTNDYKSHSTSYEIGALPPGLYLANFEVDGNPAGKYFFLVSNSRIIRQNISNPKNPENLQKLVDRNSGENLANTNLEIYYCDNKKSLKKYTITTDKQAVFQFPKLGSEEDYFTTFLVKEPKTNQYNITQNNYTDDDYSTTENNPDAITQLFTDRSIYRPGQTVYFKGITTNLINKKESVISGKKLTVKLFDANSQEIAKQDLTTNEFGSINGNFVLPIGILNGMFSIKIDDRFSTIFNVEEYKRPKFEISFEPVKEEYQYGKTIELKGKALSFSGVPISNVSVNYEIKKENIRNRYFWWYPVVNYNENSVLGETKTNEKGEFVIKIDPKKNESLEGVQVDNFMVKATVTDINGETQTNETSLTVASVSHYLSLSETKTDYTTTEKLTVKIEAKNYNNQNLKKSFHAKLSKLQQPNRVIRDNFLGNLQDKPLFSEDDFVQKFPYDLYSKEKSKEKVESIIFDKSIEPNNNDQYELQSKLVEGKYKLEIYNIEGKDTIKTQQTFDVYDAEKLGSQKPFLKVIAPKTAYNQAEIKSGEKVKFLVYSGVSLPNSIVNIFIQNGDGTILEQKSIKNGFLIYELPLPKDENINMLNVQFQMVAYNDVQTQSIKIKITPENQPLQIVTTVFRDKIEPGQKEKWAIKIIGNPNEKVNAEVLATMYDKSLDKFINHKIRWMDYFKKDNIIWNYAIQNNLSDKYYSKRIPYLDEKFVTLPYYNWFDGSICQKYMKRMDSEAVALDAPVTNQVYRETDSTKIEEVVVLGHSKSAISTKEKVSDAKDNEDISNIPVRENLKETAFFYPTLLTDKDGNVNFEFTSPEALTQWKLSFLAHTKDVRVATLQKTVITQKEFSVTPNYPRFLREGDELVFKTKLSNLSDKVLSGEAQLIILDAYTNQDISSKFNLDKTPKTFSIKSGETTSSQWNLKVPTGTDAIIIKTVAKAGNFSDGEQQAIAILPNRMLVTEAVPVFVKQGQTKNFVLENLKNNTSTTVQNVSTTLELTTNPIWEIIFALPSLKNDSQKSADVIFNKWFADVIANEIFQANPKVKTVFEEYQKKNLLQSNLSKNQELKQLLLDETPWVLDSKDETEQMQKLASLLDANTMKNTIQTDWEELKKLQNPDGGFSWMAGYPSSYTNSLYILKNLGKINLWLKGNMANYQSSEQKEMTDNLIKFVDNQLNRYIEIKKENAWSNFALDYLDTRNYWEKDYPLSTQGKKLKNWVISQAPKAKITDFTFFGLHRAALLFNDYGLKNLSKKLITYLKETSVETQTQGVYWKQNLNNWGWYNTKIENQAGAIEAFEKLGANENFVEELKIWLVTQKEVSHWDTSKGTASVIYTLLNSGKSWTNPISDQANISWGNQSLQPQLQATGYVKQTISSADINKNLATVTVKKDGPGIVQGGLFWQYYEDLDKIKSSENYISISKELYKKIKTTNGEELQKISQKTPLKIGDKVTVRMILNSDRPMEFVHLKDMRAAGFEPTNVLSGYQWKNNLGYYQVTKDASTNFYIEYLPKGKFVFEYDYICNAAGTFSNGIATLQNYYAPQMNAHSQGLQIKIEE